MLLRYENQKTNQLRPHGHMSVLKKTRRNGKTISSWFLPGETYGRGDEVEN